MADKWTHGTASWATQKELDENGYCHPHGLIFGYSKEIGKKVDYEAVSYSGDSHMITVAPTRSGKGTTQIIPSLMDHTGGVLCIDPKGENAIITAEARENLHGQEVAIFDPWNVAGKVLHRETAYFNPLDMLSADSENLADDALLIADSLIVPDRGDSHWSNEARAMVMGFVIHLVTSPKEEGQRHLGRLREILSLHPNDFQVLVVDMAENGVELARNAANRTMQKSERELSSVISTAQQNTHFLESPQVKKALSKSTFDFDSLTKDDTPLSAYIVLPADRLNTHGRLLRLIVSMAITAMVRAKKKPETSALFLLDEFAALGKLASVEQAFGLMAGFGMQIHAIVQDLSQLQDLYDRRWQTFLGNAGVVQVFGTRDMMTAEYVSKLCGQTTVEKISKATQDKRDGGVFISGDPDYTNMNDSAFGRPLLMPEEAIRMGNNTQVLIMPHCQPIMARKVPYYENARYYDVNGAPLFRRHPNNPDASEFWFWDSETIDRFGEMQRAKAEDKARQQAEADAQRRAERQLARDEALAKAGEATAKGLKMAGRFGSSLLKEARNQMRKDDE